MTQIERGEIDLLIRPPAGDPAGALILNHGRAADEHDLHPLLDELDPERRLLGVTTGAPLRGLPPGGRHWYVVERVGFPERETFTTSLAALGASVDGALAEHGVPIDRAIIGGFSQGTVMSWALALDPRRQAPAAVLALSGFIPTVAGWEPDFDSRRALPIYIHHGANDPVITADFGREAARRAREGGLEVVYEETGAGHWLPPEIVPRLREFIGSALPASA